jgi:hypothetical protein
MNSRPISHCQGFGQSPHRLAHHPCTDRVFRQDPGRRGLWQRIPGSGVGIVRQPTGTGWNGTDRLRRARGHARGADSPTSTKDRPPPPRPEQLAHGSVFWQRCRISSAPPLTTSSERAVRHRPVTHCTHTSRNSSPPGASLHPERRARGCAAVRAMQPASWRSTGGRGGVCRSGERPRSRLLPAAPRGMSAAGSRPTGTVPRSEGTSGSGEQVSDRRSRAADRPHEGGFRGGGGSGRGGRVDSRPGSVAPPERWISWLRGNAHGAGTRGQAVDACLSWAVTARR